MPFQTLTTTSASASQLPSSTSKPDNFTGNGSSNLYLVTFLATLFLLLFISSAIVLRSYIIRRRFQRQVDHAVAAGFLPSPRSQRFFGATPKLYNAWVTQGGHTWCEMMPISALPVQVKRRAKNDRYSPSKSSQRRDLSSQPPSIPPQEPSRLHQRLLRPFRTYHHQPHTQPISVTEPEKPPRPKIDALQVSVLVSMPSANRPVNISTSTLVKGNNEQDDEMIPEVVFGVTRLPYKPPEQFS